MILRNGVIRWRYIRQNTIVPRRNTIRNRAREHGVDPGGGPPGRSVDLSVVGVHGPGVSVFGSPYKLYGI